MKFLNLCSLFVFSILLACASNEARVIAEDGEVAPPSQTCGIDSYLNRYALYQCRTLELEENNDHVGKATPIHEISPVQSERVQPLLVIDEKVFRAQLRERDQQVVCERRLKVVLNPGVGPAKSYQKGWLTYKPQCFQFKGQQQAKGVLYGRRHQ